MTKDILIAFFMIYILNSCGVYQKTTPDLLVFDIYFADYFKNDTIDFLFNDKVLLKNINLNSEPYDLTRVNVQVYQKNKKSYAVINDTNTISVNIKDVNELKLINKNYNATNTDSIKAKDGKYIIYRGDDYGKIRLIQTAIKPGFD